MNLPKLNSKEKAVVEAYMADWMKHQGETIQRLCKTIQDLTARNEKLEKKLLIRTKHEN